MGRALLIYADIWPETDSSRADYWIYMHNFPCHHRLPNYAETEALSILQLMIVRKQNFTTP